MLSCRTFLRFDDEDSCILKPIVTFTISQNTLLADAVSRRSTSVGYCGFPRVLGSWPCATALIILEMTEVKLYTSAQCSECRSFGLAAWGVGGERKKAANQRHSCDQNIMSPSSSFCLWEIIHTRNCESGTCMVVVRNPDLFRAASDGKENKETAFLPLYPWTLCYRH